MSSVPADVYDDARVSGIKMPPHSMEAEQALLGACLVGGSNVVIDLGDAISEQDWFGADHRQIWRAIVELVDADKPVDPMTVNDRLQVAKTRIDAGLVFELFENAPGTANAGAYAEIIRQRRQARDVIDAAHKIADLGFDCAPDALDRAQGIVMGIDAQAKRGGPMPMRDTLRGWVDLMDRRKSGGMQGTSTGFPRLDARWGGMNDGDLIVIGARPAMGKTSFAMQVASGVSETDPVLVFSLEMGASQLLDREVSRRTRIPLPAIRSGRLSGDDWAALPAGITPMRDLPMLIDDTAPLSIGEIRARARRVHQRTPLRLLVIDYLQLVDSEGSNANERISNISRQCKLLAKELQCPVMLLSQLNRDLEKRPNKRPSLADLRDSGAVEQDADVVLMLYRDEIYNPNTPHRGRMELITAKVRQGEPGTDYARTHLERCRIDPIDEDLPPADVYEAPREAI